MYLCHANICKNINPCSGLLLWLFKLYDFCRRTIGPIWPKHLCGPICNLQRTVWTHLFTITHTQINNLDKLTDFVKCWPWTTENSFKCCVSPNLEKCYVSPNLHGALINQLLTSLHTSAPGVTTTEQLLYLKYCNNGKPCYRTLTVSAHINAQKVYSLNQKSLFAWNAIPTDAPAVNI